MNKNPYDLGATRGWNRKETYRPAPSYIEDIKQLKKEYAVIKEELSKLRQEFRERVVWNNDDEENNS